MSAPLDQLYPPFRASVERLVAELRANGDDWRVTSAYRSLAEQMKLRLLYLQGKGGKAAPAGKSAHNFGLAVDLTLYKAGKPTWEDADYDKMAAIADAFPGLRSGKGFGDRPHVEYRPGGPWDAAALSPLREAERKGGLGAAWKLLPT